MLKRLGLTLGPFLFGGDMSDDEEPSITLGRHKFWVPEFSWREVQKLIPAIKRLTKINWAEVDEAGMTEITDTFYWICQRAPNKQMEREQFENLPIRLPEFLKAIPVITTQAGMKADDAGEQPAAG